jgi:prepilin signal peptidase PulO-like enzyme (type II secretory pathway)
MTQFALAGALIVALDCGIAAIASIAAVKCGVRVRFFNPGAGGLLLALTVLQLFVVMRYTAPAGIVTILMLGAAAVCAISDAQSGYVFDAVTAPALLLTLCIAAVHSAFVSAVLGAAAGGTALGVLYVLTSGRGLGLGDVKLACCIGAAMGIAGALRSLQFAFVLGGAYAAVLLLLRRAQWGQSIGFAPFLFAGTVVAALEAAR